MTTPQKERNEASPERQKNPQHGKQIMQQGFLWDLLRGKRNFFSYVAPVPLLRLYAGNKLTTFTRYVNKIHKILNG